MQINLVTKFLLSSLVGLLCLMPLWYYLASWLSTPVIYLAGEVCSTLFHWVVRYEHIGASGMLVTDLRVIAGQGLAQPGWLAPVADFRLHGYGMVMLWSMLLASRPTRLWGKLALGTGVMWILQAVGVCIQWLNDVLNQSGPGVLAQVSPPAWAAEVVAFCFHFNLFIFTALAPVLLWLTMNRPFVRALWNDPVPAA